MWAVGSGEDSSKIIFFRRVIATTSTVIPGTRDLSHEGSLMEYYSAIKKNENFALVTTWMDIERVMLSEESQTKTNAI